MPGWLDIQTTTRKNGQQVSWFKDTLGRRVGTRAGVQDSWVSAEQLAWLASYYIELQQEQLDNAIGSDGQPMPRLQGGSVATFHNSATGERYFASRIYSGYQGQKRKMGLSTKRDLYGPGKNGHMRDDIRINYLDDRMAKISITRNSSRIKALANERRCPWWGLSPASAVKFAYAQASIYGGAVADYLANIGLVDSTNYIVQLARRLSARRRTFRKLVA